MMTKTGLALTLLMSGTMLAGCTSIKTHEGFIADPALSDSILPGVDNKQSVQATLGRPTFQGQFTQNDWYYVSRNLRQHAFRTKKAASQEVIHITFDNSGSVLGVEKSGIERVVRINPEDDKTPTLGNDRGFFEELFSNIGQVGGVGSGQSSDPTGPN